MRSSVCVIRMCSKTNCTSPAEFLDQHAVHLLKITDGSSALTLTTEVMGLDSYVAGALQVIKVLDRLEAKKYQITDLISMGLV